MSSTGTIGNPYTDQNPKKKSKKKINFNSHLELHSNINP